MRPYILGFNGKGGGPFILLNWERDIGKEEGRRMGLGGDERGGYSWDTK